jgi:hypothetical protein
MKPLSHNSAPRNLVEEDDDAGDTAEEKYQIELIVVK